MTHFRPATIAVTLGFLAVICSVGWIQGVLEARQGEWPQVFELFREKPTARHLRAYEETLEDNSWVGRRLRRWAQYAQYVLLQEAGAKALVGRNGWLYYKPGVQYLTERPRLTRGDPVPADPLPAILAFRDALAARGIHLLVLPVPNKESVYPEHLTRRADGMTSVVCSETDHLLKGLQSAGVEVVDLFDLFAAEKRQRGRETEPLYLARDSHWSPAGVALAAEAVARRLFDLGWIRPGSVAYETQVAPVSRLGDLVRMLQVPAIEDRTEPEWVRCRQVIRREDGQLYRDDPDGEILVLGDSFLRIYEQDEPGAAGFIAHLARELKQPVASVVNDGGASTLVRQELHRRPGLLAGKKVVLWQFVERDIRFGTEGWQIVPLPPRE